MKKMKTKQLLTHPSFCKVMVNDVCVARINKLSNGNWSLISNDNYAAAIETSEEIAMNWITTQSLTVALSN